MKALQTVSVMAALAVVRCNSAASPSRTKHSNARQVNQESQLPAAPTLVPAASAKRSSFTKRYGELAKTYAASSEAANLVEPVSVKASAGVRYVADATAAQGIPASNAVPEPPAAATGYGGGGGGGGHGHGGYFQYARVPGYDTYEFGYRKGNPYHFQERHETRHGPHFRTKQRWGDKHGGYGEHYWEYNHVPKYHH